MQVGNRRWPLAAVLLVVAMGCERQRTTYPVSEAVAELDREVQEQVQDQLRTYCGTLETPKLLGDDDVDEDWLRHGREVYERRCQQCHGLTGDGNGIAAAYMFPRPRNYRRGIFKFTSTPYGAKPLRDDLIRTIDRGVTGTSMPSFDRLPKEDLEAVADYVLVLTHRGELEGELVIEAENEDAIDPNYVPDFVDGILGQWEAARTQIVRPLTPQPELTIERASAGRAAFLTKGCSKCHGEDGRGRTKDNVGEDVWGETTFAADLTSGMLHGGQDPEDIYRRIYAGINGTPMPSFAQALASEPDTIWDLVAYVLYVADRRRLQTIGEEQPPLLVDESASETTTTEGD